MYIHKQPRPQPHIFGENLLRKLKDRSRVIMAENRQGEKPTKVTYIQTQHIKVDATNFKSVVQSLTGKNASTLVAPVKKKKKPRVTHLKDEASTSNNGAIGESAGVFVSNDHGQGVGDDDSISKERDLMLQDFPFIQDSEIMCSWDLHQYSTHADFAS